jgi:hypothetical protein
MWTARQAYEEALHCYADGTEILTERGFVDFADLTDDDKVAQYHTDGTITYTKPKEIICDDYEGIMYRFYTDSNTLDVTVTPNHRCVVFDPRSDTPGEPKIIRAENLRPSNYQIPVSGLQRGQIDEFTWWDSFMVAYQADGTLCNAHVGNNLGLYTSFKMVRFGLKREDKKARLIEIISELGLRHTITIHDSAPGYHIFYVWVPADTDLSKDFNWIDASKVSSGWISAFIKELGHWDGCFRGVNSVTYTNTNKTAIDKVTLLAHLSGRRAGVFCVQPYGNRKQAWQVHLYERTIVSGKVVHTELIDYSGKVRCVAVDTGMIMIRSNGVISISGNTEAYQYCIETFGFNPEEVYTRFLKERALYNKIAYTKNWHDLLASADCSTLEGKQRFIKGYGGWALGLEGGWFRMGFSLVFGLARNRKMMNTAEQFQYILRDEILHMHTGLKTLQVTQEEYPEAWTDETKGWFMQMISDVHSLESEFISGACHGVLSFSPVDYLEHFRFTMNSYATRLGLPEPFPGARPAMSWLDEMSGAWRKEKNFFETRVTEYQTASALTWDDDDQAT